MNGELLYKQLKSGQVNKSQLTDNEIGQVYKYMIDSKRVSTSEIKPLVAEKYNLYTPKQKLSEMQIQPKPQPKSQPITVKPQPNFMKDIGYNTSNLPRPDIGYKPVINQNKVSINPENELVDTLSTLSMGLNVPNSKNRYISSMTPINRQVFGNGNISLYNRPKVKNADGSISTVRSMSFSDDSGKEILIPTVSDDGRIMSDDEAIEQYYKTGKYLGKFDTIKEADIYAEQLHDNQETYYMDNINASNNNKRDSTPQSRYSTPMQSNNNNFNIPIEHEDKDVTWQNNPLKSAGANIWAGFGELGRGFANVVDMTLGDKNIPIVDNYLEKIKSDIMAEDEKLAQINQGKIGQFAGDVFKGVGQSIPSVAMALAGVPVAGANPLLTSGGTQLVNNAAQLANPSLLLSTQQAIKDIATNPNLIPSMIQSVGSQYGQAINSGATKEQAIKSAL